MEKNFQNNDLPFIYEVFDAEKVTPLELDKLLNDGWRHFGCHFFRYNLNLHKNEVKFVIPLRVKLADLTFSKSQRRLIKHNADLSVTIGDVIITEECEQMFDQHKDRFVEGKPTSLFDFLDETDQSKPCGTKQMSVFDGDKLVAVSYFDLGKTMVSGVYAFFDVDQAARGLGNFTMIKEMEYAIKNGFEYYHLGYAYSGESFYDYKKRFAATEAFDWKGNWLPYVRENHR